MLSELNSLTNFLLETERSGRLFKIFYRTNIMKVYKIAKGVHFLDLKNCVVLLGFWLLDLPHNLCSWVGNS